MVLLTRFRGLLTLCLLSVVSVGGAAQAALTITATADIDVARPQQQLEVQFVVANSDAFARTGVEISLVFPGGTNQVFESEFDGDCPATTCTAGETAIWSLGTVPAGGSVMVNVPAQVLNNAPDGTMITFSPTVTDDTVDSDSDSTTIEIDGSSKYDLAISEDTDPATAGSQVTYKLAYSLLGSVAGVTQSLLTFDVPAGATFVSASDGGTNNAGTVEWPLGFLQPGEGGIREVTVAFGGGLGAGTVIATTAEIANVANGAERIGAGAATAVGASIPFGLSVESVMSTVRTQEYANLQYTVTNNDPFTRFGVTLRGIYPGGFFQVFESEFDGNCVATTCTAGERITWTLGDIPAGGSVTVDLPPQLNTIQINGAIQPFFAQVTDSAGASARHMNALRVQTDSIYDLALADNADPVSAGDELAYKLTWGLRANAAGVNNTRLIFPIPDGTTFVSATGGGALNAGVVEWPLGVLQPGDSGVREVTVDVGAGLAAGTLIEAFGELQGITSPAERARSEANTVVAASVPLEIAIEAAQNPARTPETTNLQLTVTNNDPFTRFGVDLYARHPQTALQTFESEFDGDCASTTCTAAERIFWALGDIPAGGAVTVDLPVRTVSSATAGELVNYFAWVEDDLGSNARKTDTYPITTDTPYDLHLQENADPATAGSELTYTLNWGYRSDAAAVAQSTLRMPLPDGVTFVSASDGGVLNAGAVEWQLGFVQPGQNGVRTVTVAINAGSAAGEVIEAHADLFANATPDLGHRAEADTVIAAGLPLSLAIETTPSPARTSERLHQRFTVTNNDPFTRFGVVLEARFPDDTIQAFESEFDGDCGSTTCSAGERVTWMLGDIPAGGAASVDLPYQVLSGLADGLLINMFAKATDDQGAQILQSDSVRVQTDTVYELGLAEDLDPVTPGSLVTYTLTYGYRDDAPAVSNTTLRFHVPDGATFVSASAGGVHNAGVVEWPLGFLPPGDGELATVTVTADAGLPSGSVLEASAELFTAGTGEENARAEADTVVAASVPLSLDIVANRNNVAASETIELLLTVTNNDAFTRFGVELYARYPQDANSLAESVEGFDGDCGSTTCTAGERVTWLLGDIPATSSVTVLFPPPISGFLLDGQVMDFFAWAEDDQALQTRDRLSRVAGCLESVDTDCDGISDTVDNCTVVANLNQRDTDGDLIGNACDPDIAPPVNDCSVNFLDLNAMKIAFFSTPADVEWNPDADLNGDNSVNFGDLNVMKGVFFGPPGPSAAGCN